MTMKMPATVLVAFVALVAMPAFANRVVLYEGQEMRGRQVTVMQAAPNLGYMGFENRASSMWVMSGTWEFCTEPYFRGDCRVFGPGEYPRLGSQSNRISSGRPVGEGPVAVKPSQPVETWRPPQPGEAWNPAGAAEVTLYDRQDFQRPLATLSRPTPNFEPLGFNDAAASLVVSRGTWQFCTDAFYRGECVTYGPGRYASLPGKDDRFSSARPVEGGWGGGGPGGWGSAGGGDQGPARIRLFEYENFGGRSVWLDRDSQNFDRIGFNDRAESVIVEGGAWRLCSDAGGGGECRMFRPGQYPSLPPDMRSRISSAYRR